MTAGRPPFPRALAPAVAELRRLGVCWKEIAMAVGWTVSPKTLGRMAAEADGRRPPPVLAEGRQNAPAAAGPARSGSMTNEERAERWNAKSDPRPDRAATRSGATRAP